MVSGQSDKEARPQLSTEVPPTTVHSHSSHDRPKRSGQRGHRARSPGLGCELGSCRRWQVRKKQRKLEWAKPRELNSSKSSSQMGMLGPAQGRAHLGTSAGPAGTRAVGSWQASLQLCLQLPAPEGMAN